ncbi:hypothetical protein ILYODFUR_030486 [Ilyodon furcidens]|uniref:Uncharacterized protein n=1 Tax=Ilyodon furcidens TaxID=33524 RepID=A0ABV0UM52_9TELE
MPVDACSTHTKDHVGSTLLTFCSRLYVNNTYTLFAIFHLRYPHLIIPRGAGENAVLPGEVTYSPYWQKTGCAFFAQGVGNSSLTAHTKHTRVSLRTRMNH